MVTILPFIADPLLYRNPPNYFLPLYKTDKQAYISQCNRQFLSQRKVIVSAITSGCVLVKKTSRALKEMLGASK